MATLIRPLNVPSCMGFSAEHLAPGLGDAHVALTEQNGTRPCRDWKLFTLSSLGILCHWEDIGILEWLFWKQEKYMEATADTITLENLPFRAISCLRQLELLSMILTLYISSENRIHPM